MEASLKPGNAAHNGTSSEKVALPSQDKTAAPPQNAGGRKLALGVVVGLALAGAGAYAFSLRGWESTDDAAIEGTVVSVSPRVAGHVARVLVKDNQDVQKGDVLVEIDARDYQTRVDEAQARLKGDLAQRLKTQADLARYQALFARDEASKQTLDNAAAADASAEADTEYARADLRQAELNLSYTRILAPQAGRITHKSVEEGDYVPVGQELFALVPHDAWVIANFKETQLKSMRPGQRAEISVDAYSGKLTGHVDSIQEGTGARFSVLPPENATGNYVKILQRVPVKIVFDSPADAGKVLGPGMSVDASVKVN
jgi:membrane fusion protein (multidrug efflux system)